MALIQLPILLNHHLLTTFYMPGIVVVAGD